MVSAARGGEGIARSKACSELTASAEPTAAPSCDLSPNGEPAASYYEPSANLLRTAAGLVRSRFALRDSARGSGWQLVR